MGTIKNFGHFWAEKTTHWNFGNKGEKGHLKGYCGRGKKRKIVDFRTQIGVYVLFTENREVIYVGQVGANEKKTLFGRLKRHTRDHLRGRWSHFSWFGLREINEKTLSLEVFENVGSELPNDVLDEIEAILIHLFEPRLNLQRGKWKQTQEFYQYLDSDPASFGDEDEG
jgi:hypothetical protein